MFISVINIVNGEKIYTYQEQQAGFGHDVISIGLDPSFSNELPHHYGLLRH